MSTLYLDLETFGSTPIKHGAHRYAEDAEVLLVAYAWDDEPVTVWDMTTGDHRLGAVQMLVDTADRVVIHNSSFDRTVLRHQGIHIPVDKVVDTMVLAMQHSLPASLGMLCDVLGVPMDKAKDKDGKKLIQLFSKPCPMIGKGSSNTPGSTWTRCETYMAACRIGTILTVSTTCGNSTKELMTVASESMSNSPDPLSELLSELRDLWPLVREF